MPIVVHHGNAGTFEQQQALGQSMRGLTGAIQGDRKLDLAEDESSQRIGLATRKMDLEEAKFGVVQEELKRTREREDRERETGQQVRDALKARTQLPDGVQGPVEGDMEGGVSGFGLKADALLESPDLTPEDRTILMEGLELQREIEKHEGQMYGFASKVSRHENSIEGYDVEAAKQILEQFDNKEIDWEDAERQLDQLGDAGRFANEERYAHGLLGQALAPESGFELDDEKNKAMLKRVERMLDNMEPGDSWAAVMGLLNTMNGLPTTPAQMSALEQNARNEGIQMRDAALSAEPGVQPGGKAAGLPYDEWMEKNLTMGDQWEGNPSMETAPPRDLQDAIGAAWEGEGTDEEKFRKVASIAADAGLHFANFQELIEFMRLDLPDETKKAVKSKKKKKEAKASSRPDAETMRRGDPGGPLN